MSHERRFTGAFWLVLAVACTGNGQQTYVIANNKPSERSMKACILKHHLLPAFGDMPLDAIKMHPKS